MSDIKRTIDVFRAVSQGQDIEELMYLHPECINDQNDVGQTMLLLCTENEHYDKCEVFLKSGADVNISDTRGNIALHYASCASFTERLIKHGSKVNVCNAHGRTAVHEAALHGHIDRLKTLIKYNADVNITDDQGGSPLHLACVSTGFKDTKAIVQMLLEANANIDVQCRNGKTPLHVIIQSTQSADADIHLLFLQRGVDLNIKDMRGHTVLHDIFFKGEMPGVYVEYDTVELIDSFLRVTSDLIKHGVDLNSVDRLGMTPMHLAAAQMPACVSELMIKHGGMIDSQDNLGRSPLHLSACNTDPDVLSCLLEHSADLNLKDVSKRTVLHWAARYGKPEAICSIIEHFNLKVSSTRGIFGDLWQYINAQDCHGCIPAHYGIISQHHNDITKLLWETNCSMNQVNKEGTMPRDMLYLLADSVREEITGGEMKKTESTKDDSRRIALSTDELFEDGKMEQVDGYVIPSSLRKINDPNEFVSKIWESLEVDFSERSNIFSAINSDVNVFLKSLIKIVSNKGKIFESKIFPTGSVNEGTKIVSPNEFDFILSLNSLASIVEIVETPLLTPCHVRLKYKSQCDEPNEASEYFDEQGYLVGERLMTHYFYVLFEALGDVELWQGHGFDPMEDLYFSYSPDKAAISLILMWCGDITKRTTVALDLVPAIHLPNWWPQSARQAGGCITQEMIQTGCHVVIKPQNLPEYGLSKIGNPRNYLAISFAVAEGEMIKAGKSVSRQAYMICKLMKTRKFQLNMEINIENGVILHDKSAQKIIILVKSLLSSYIFKNVLLYLINDEDNLIRSEKSRNETNQSELLCFTRWLLLTLNNFMLGFTMPYFFIPGHDIIHTFQKDNFMADYRNIVSQLLLSSVLDDNKPIKLLSQKGKYLYVSRAVIQKHSLSRLVRAYLGAPTYAAPFLLLK